jgi:tricorn protease
MDKSIVFGIPQIGCLDNSNHYLENQALQPDMLQYNTPEEVLRGEDAQLKAAVNHLLQQLDQ